MSATMTAAQVIERDRRYVADALKIRYFPFVLERGEGPYLFDVEGKRYLDFGAGWALAGLGYSNNDVREAIARQLDRTTYGGLLSGINLPAVDLAEKLVSLVPGDFEKKVCKICLVPHDEEIHAATVSIHGWFREQVNMGLWYEEDDVAADGAAVAVA